MELLNVMVMNAIEMGLKLKMKVGLKFECGVRSF